MTRALSLVVFLAAGVLAAGTPAQPAKYFNDLEKTPPGKPPEDMMALNGEFDVKVEGNNHFLEVTPDPVELLGLQFGPDGLSSADVTAKIYATSSGRREPEIGVGCAGGGYFKLMLMPAAGIVELRRGDDGVAAAPYDKWKSGQWFSFRIKLGPAGEGKWHVQGKVWPATEAEPSDWAISYAVNEAPAAGKASVWTLPLSETPVRFDDLSVVGEVAAAKGG